MFSVNDKIRETQSERGKTMKQHHARHLPSLNVKNQIDEFISRLSTMTKKRKHDNTGSIWIRRAGNATRTTTVIGSISADGRRVTRESRTLFTSLSEDPLHETPNEPSTSRSGTIPNFEDDSGDIYQITPDDERWRQGRRGAQSQRKGKQGGKGEKEAEFATLVSTSLLHRRIC